MTKLAQQYILDAHLHGGGGLSPPSIRLFINTALPAEWEPLFRLAAGNNGIFPFFGLHPWFIDRVEDDWLSRLEECLVTTASGIGEIGLDRAKERLGAPFAMERQLYFFEAQLDLAVRLDRPVSIHCVRAWDILSKVVKKYPLKRGLIHGFNSSPQVASELLELGFYLSFSPALHRASRGLKELFKTLPLDRLFLETDSQDGARLEELGEHYKAAAELRETNYNCLIRKIYENGEIFTNRETFGS